MGHRIDTPAAGRPDTTDHPDDGLGNRPPLRENGRRRVAGGRWIVRPVAVIIAVVLAVESISGCAGALRALALADVIVTLGEASRESDEPQNASTAGPLDATVTVRARVAGTRSGLWVNERPGAGRLFAVPEGTAVVVRCRAEGPAIDGSQGRMSSWSRVETDDGRSGFMSDAYLAADLGADVGPCTE